MNVIYKYQRLTADIYLLQTATESFLKTLRLCVFAVFALNSFCIFSRFFAYLAGKKIFASENYQGGELLCPNSFV